MSVNRTCSNTFEVENLPSRVDYLILKNTIRQEDLDNIPVGTVVSELDINECGNITIADVLNSRLGPTLRSIQAEGSQQ